MPKVKLHPPFVEISGTMGDFVFKKGKKEEGLRTIPVGRSETER